MKYARGTRFAMRRLASLANSLLGYPAEGRDIGGGIHAKHDVTRGVGWTLQHALPRKHPTLDEWAYPMDEELAARVMAPRAARTLDPAALDELATAVTDATTLSSDWEPKEVTNETTTRI